VRGFDESGSICDQYRNIGAGGLYHDEAEGLVPDRRDDEDINEVEERSGVGPTSPLDLVGGTGFELIHVLSVTFARRDQPLVTAFDGGEKDSEALRVS
jgi:hypothetical protein